MKTIKLSPLKLIDLGQEQVEFLVLSNYNNLFINNQLELCLYDGTFNFIKKITEIDGTRIEANAIAHNMDQNLIYVTDCKNNQVIIMDLDLNKIKSIGKKGADKGLFNEPAGICCDDKGVFVCDSQNKRIQKFSNKLEFIQSFSLEYEPGFIQVMRDIACVSPRNIAKFNFIYFYNSIDFTVKFKYYGHIGRISTIGSFFYELDFNNKIYVYDCEGYMINRLERKEVNCNRKSGSINLANKELYILNASEKYLLKLEV